MARETRTLAGRDPARRALVALVVLAGLLGALMVFGARPAQAATFTVNSIGDAPDNAASDGVCYTNNFILIGSQFVAECTLRAAIQQANANGLSDTVNFAPGVGGTITLSAGLDGLSILDDSLNTDLVVNGPGADVLAVSGGDAVRPFRVGSGVVATINGLTIRNGKAPAGGGINNQGALTLNDSTVSGNTANYGGGIINYGTLTLNDSSISGNKAEHGHHGGGIYSYTNLTDRTTTIRNSTISDNTADTYGGGVYNDIGLTRIENSTITDNTAPAGEGSGVASRSNANTSTEVFSTIISANDNNDDVRLTGGSTNSFDSRGFNLIGGGDATAFFNKTGDQRGIPDPGLGLLVNNGGPTPTHALLGASPALDKGTNAGCPATDQRGARRPQRGTCDIGSFERRNSAPVARNDSYGGVEDRTLNVPARGVLRNDTDAEGDALRAARVSGPGKGTLTLRPNGSLTYKPKRNFSGVVRFVYRASDGEGGVDNATATIRVRARPG